MVSNKISGWYYDLQLENRLTSISLHPSKVLSGGGDNKENSSNNEEEQKGNKGKDWKTIEEAGLEKDPDEEMYGQKPICRAIATEDFNVSVANSWSEFGNDMIGSMWNSLKPLAPYAGFASQAIKDAVSSYEEMKTRDPEGYAKIQESSISSAMADLMKMISNKLNDKETNITEFLNRSLVVQGTRFSYYSGSGTSFGNLMMKFTLFPTFDENGQYLTVNKQIGDLLPYCVGEFITGTEGLGGDKKIKEFIDNLIGWQKPPGGFEAYARDVDVIQPGTLMLRVGAYYSITNLVIENATFNFSKQMAKNPTPGAVEKISPLCCEVTIQLRPATKYSDKSLRAFISSRNSGKIIQKISEEMEKNLYGKLNDYDVY